MKISFKISTVLLLVLGAFLHSKAQSDYLIIGDKQQILINRLDIKLKNDPSLRFSTVKPFERKSITEKAEWIDSLDKAGALDDLLTATDRYDLQSLLQNNSDWTKAHPAEFYSDKKIFSTFFHNEAHLYETKGKDFSFVADPVLNFQFGKASDDHSNLFFNTRGVRMRGTVDDKIGFYAYISDNQERDPAYVRNWVGTRNGLPGNGYYKPFDGHDNAYDYFDVRGGITFSAGKKAQFQLAYDRFFIGDGYRSLFLSDFSSPMFFLRSTVQLHPKWSYTGVIAQTVAPFISWAYNRPIQDTTRPRNYMMFHHLAYQATDWLQLGLFENSIYNTNGAQPGLLSTFLYNTALSQGVKKGVRSSVGLDFKAAVTKSVQAYGQLFFSDFGGKDFLSLGKSSWENRKAIQLGAKYIDAFTIPNLDLQAEYNTVRPYTYSDNWDVNNYSHYNQPLAHPMGANFREWIGVANYRPWKKIYLTGKVFYTQQGLNDANGVNYGSNIFQPHQDNGVTEINTLDGEKSTYLMASFSAGYELIQNLFVEGTYVSRRVKYTSQPTDKINYYNIGFRWNFARRVFEF